MVAILSHETQPSRGPSPLRTDLASRYFVALHDQLHFKIQLIIGKKLGQRLQRLKGCAIGEKILISRECQRANPDTHSRLLIPDFIPHNGSRSELLRNALSFVHTGQGRRIEAIPRPGKLFDLNRDIEIITENLFQRDCRPRLLAQHSDIMKKSKIRHRLPVKKPRSAHSDEIE